MQEPQAQHRRRTSSLREAGISRPDQDKSMVQLASVASALLKQACEVLEQIIAMPNGSDILTHESTLVLGSSIGKHLRHSLDHYKLLLDSVPRTGFSSQPLNVNYDTRVRQVDMESRPDTALQCFQETDRRLSEAVKNTSLDQPLMLTALTPHKQDFGSTFGRELWFVALHAIHHYSLLRVIACGELGMTLPDKFGVAPSTLAFRQYKHQVDGPISSERLEKGAEQVAGKVKL